MGFDINKEKIHLNKNGRDVTCDVLFTFDCSNTNKSYVGYTDHSVGSNGRKNIYVSSFNPFNINMVLEDVTDKRELDMVNEVLQQLDAEANG